MQHLEIVVFATDNLNENNLKESKYLLDKGIQVDDISNITKEDLLRRVSFSETGYFQALDYNQNRLSIIYWRKSSEADTCQI